jgi:hypothetical protein
MIPRFTAESSVYDNTSIIVPAAPAAPVSPGVGRQCYRYCTSRWSDCLDSCPNPYPGSPCYAKCDRIWNNCVDSCY